MPSAVKKPFYMCDSQEQKGNSGPTAIKKKFHFIVPLVHKNLLSQESGVSGAYECAV